MTTIARRALFAAGLFAVMPLVGLEAQQGSEQRDDRVTIAYYEELRYPPLAFQARIQGVVVIQAKLDDDGKVVDSSAIWGSKYLIPDCLANAKKWRFQPGSSETVVIVYRFYFGENACTGTNYSSFELIPPNFASISSCAPLVQP
jgi:TonB family protein